MKEMLFTLAPSVRLIEKDGSYYLFSTSPLRLLRINQQLYSILSELDKGLNLAGTTSRIKPVSQSHIIELLLLLVDRGYLRLEISDSFIEYPFVSIVIPVHNQIEKLRECLRSLKELNYPREKYEIIVVDDCSHIPVEREIQDADIKIIRLNRPVGPAAARNSGVIHSSGEILGFIDADCYAEKNWLIELIPFFQVEKIGAVGGFVDSYHNIKLLDKYEKVNSPLNLGNNLIFQNGKTSTFYIPSCNLLVSKKAFTAVHGFKEELKVGEDVDFCWRLRDAGYQIIYVPAGRIRHMHRNKLLHMVKRRFDYGTSESVLYNLHKNKRKSLVFPVWSGLSLISIVISILMMNPLPLVCLPFFLGLDFYFKSKAFSVKLAPISVSMIIRNWGTLGYSLAFHLMRYYMLLLIPAGIVYHPIWIIGAFILIYCSIIEYIVKKPALFFPFFGFIYIIEHFAYQSGVFYGCLRHLKFRSYLVSPRFRLY